MPDKHAFFKFAASSAGLYLCTFQPLLSKHAVVSIHTLLFVVYQDIVVYQHPLSSIRRTPAFRYGYATDQCEQMDTGEQVVFRTPCVQQTYAQ